MAGLYDAIPLSNRRNNPLYRDNGSSVPLGTADEYAQAIIDSSGDFTRGLHSALGGSASSVQRYLGANESALANQQEAARWAPEIRTTDQVHGVGDAVRYGLGAMGEAVGSYGPALLGGVTGRALAGGRGAYLGASAAYQPVMAGSHMQELDANAATAGMSESDKRWRGTGIGALQAGVEGLAPGYMVNRLAKPQALVKAGFGPAVGRAAGVLATDAALEGGGAAVSDVIGQGSVMQLDPTTAYDPNQTFQAGVREAVGGAGMGAVHAPLAVAHDYLDKGAREGGSLAGRGARAGIDAVAPAAGRAYGATADLFKTSADFHMQHPEFAGLTTPLSMPKGMKADDTVGINAYLDAEGAKRSAAAKAMAQRMLDNPDMHSNEDLHEAQNMLNTDDPDAWEGFANGVSLRQKRENVVDALGRFTSYVGGKFGGLKDKAGELKDQATDELRRQGVVGLKHNAERTALEVADDDEFSSAMYKTMADATDLGDYDLTQATFAVKDYVLKDMVRADGELNVPSELVAAFGDRTGEVILNAYETLRRQKRTGHLPQDSGTLLNELNTRVKEQQGDWLNMSKIVGYNLTPTAMATTPESTWTSIGQEVSRYIGQGKINKKAEAVLKTWFGPNTNDVLKQITQLHKDARDQRKVESTGTNPLADTGHKPNYSDEHGSDRAKDDYENQTQEFDAPAATYHFGGKEGQPFDTAYPNVGEHMMDKIKALDTSRFETVEDDVTHKPRVWSDSIGIVDYAAETGDRTALDKLIAEHGTSGKNHDELLVELNKRFQVLVTNERVRNESEGVDIDPPELDVPAERKHRTVKSSWQDVEKVGMKDVSTIAHGRLYLTKDMPDKVHDDMHATSTFVTSAQKLISKMWDRKAQGAFDENTAEQAGDKDMLNMFSAGLSSLLDTGTYTEDAEGNSKKNYVFKQGLKIKLADGTMKEVSSVKDLPDDFVLWSGKSRTVTLGDAKRAKSEGVRELKNTYRDKNETYVDAKTGKKEKKFKEDRKPTDKIAGTDIPTATIGELRAEYARVNKQLLKDEYARLLEGEKTFVAAKRRHAIEKAFGEDAWQLKDAKKLPDEVRSVLREKLESLEEAGVDLEYREKGTGAKKTAGPVEQDAAGRRAEKDAAWNEGKGWSGYMPPEKAAKADRPDMGLTEAEIREKHKGVSPLRMQRLIRTEAAHQRREEDRIEQHKKRLVAKPNTERHFTGESEEMAEAQAEQKEDEARRVDELTGLELQPRGVQSADQRVRLLDKRIDALRAEYKALNEKIKEYEAKTGVNAVREGNLKKWRAELEMVKAKGLKLGAERTELGRVVPVAEKASETSALKKIQEARAKARAEKADSTDMTDREFLERKISMSKDSIERLEVQIEGLKVGRVQERLERSNGGDRKMLGAEAENSRLQSLLADHKRMLKDAEAELAKLSDTGVKHNMEKTKGEFIDHYSSGLDELHLKGAVWRSGDSNIVEVVSVTGLTGESEEIKGKFYYEGFTEEGDQVSGWATSIKEAMGELAKYDVKIGEPVRAKVEVRSPFDEMFNKEKTGMSDSRSMNDVEAIELLHKLLGKDIDAAFTSVGALDGSGTWRRDPKTGKALIRIAIDALDPTSIAYHEAMHEFMQRLLDDKHSRASKVLQDAANSEPVLRQMQRIFAAEPAVLKQLENDPAERVAYMFQLWSADKIHIGPQTETVFRKIVNMIKKVLGFAANDKNALEIMQQFAMGQMSDRGAIARVLGTQESRGAYLRKVGAIMKPVVNSGAEWVGWAENALTGSENPALDWIGRQLHNKTGSQGDKQGYLSAETQENNKWMNKFATVLALGDKEDVALAVEGLQAKTWHADPIVLSIQKGIAGVFDKMYDYMQEAGVKRWDEKANEWTTVRKVKDYRLPVSWDVAKIIADSEKFKNLLFEHHMEALTDIARKANEEIAAKKHAGKYTASWAALNNPTGKQVTEEDIADALLKRVISTNGQVELQESASSIGFSPFAKAVNERTLSNWINSAAFAEFQEKDVANILSAYVGQVTKRAEYSRRFGPDGSILQAKMDEAWNYEIDKIMKEKHGVEGAVVKAKNIAGTALSGKGGVLEHATPLTFEDALARLAGEGVDGKEITKQATKNLEPARRAIMAQEGTLGHDISPLLRKATAYSIVYTNVRLLGYAMFSNLIDPLGIMVRGGEFKDAYSTFKRGMRDVGREWGNLTGLREPKPEDRDEAVRVAEMIGTVDNAGFMSTMGTMYGSQFLGKWAREANDSFFRWNGMEAFNKAMRVGATQAAISFIKRHYEKPNKHSDRYFKELNLSREAVQIDSEGGLNVENPEVQQAIMRWVDGAQLRPNAAIRPTMASDPHYATFYHLKQFMYAMQAVILKRVQVEIKNGNTDPLILLLAGYVPMMLAADAAKGLLQAATGGGDPYWQNTGMSGIVSHGIQRAGLLGVGQMAVDVAEYGPSGLGGPMVEQAASAVSDPMGKTVAEAVAVGPLNMALKGTTWTNN